VHMWKFEGRWCIGRSINVGTERCRAFVEANVDHPQDIENGAEWMVRPSDGVAHAPNNSVKLVVLRRSGQKKANDSLQDEEVEVSSVAGVDVTTAQLERRDIFVKADTDTQALADEIQEQGPFAGSIWVEADCDTLELVPDEKAAPLIRTALLIGTKQLRVFNLEWGEACVAAFVEGMESNSCIEELHVHYLNNVDLLLRMLQAIAKLRGQAAIRHLGLANNMVGLDGLRSIIACAENCSSLVSVDLFNTGPWVDGGSIGCFKEKDDADVLLLQELWTILHSHVRKTKIQDVSSACPVQNEAFMDDVNGGGVLLHLRNSQ